jgi:hypothetical protein
VIVDDEDLDFRGGLHGYTPIIALRAP